MWPEDNNEICCLSRGTRERAIEEDDSLSSWLEGVQASGQWKKLSSGQHLSHKSFSKRGEARGWVALRNLGPIQLARTPDELRDLDSIRELPTEPSERYEGKGDEQAARIGSGRISGSTVTLAPELLSYSPCAASPCLASSCRIGAKATTSTSECD